MAKSIGVWGIDMGQCAFKAIRLEMIGGKPTATAFDYIEHAKILNQPDADPDQLTREALDKFLSRNPMRNDHVVIGVPGQSGLARFVKLPPVEEKKIGDIVRFEAKQQIPFPLEEVIWDYQKIGSGVVTDGFAMETEIGLFAMKRDLINQFLQHFLDVKVEVHAIQMIPLALCNFLAYDLLGQEKSSVPSEAAGKEETSTAIKDGKSTAIKDAPDSVFKKRCAVALDIGTDNSNLVITDGDRIIWQRPIPVGGNHFTRALTKDLKLTFVKAEHVKRNATKSPDLKRILSALRPVLNDFVNEVQRSLGFFTNTNRDAKVEYLMGLGNAFRLPGLQKYLSEKLQLEVRKLQKLERVEGGAVLGQPMFQTNVLAFATAYSLALQGLKLTRLQTNLLPPEIKFERDIRSKKPWAVAAAATLLIGAASTTIGFSVQNSAIVGKTVADAKNEGGALLKQIAKGEADYKKEEEQVKAYETAVKSIIAGQDERINWILLNRFINECLPAPGLRVEGTLKSKAGDNFIIVDETGKSHEVSGALADLFLVNDEEVDRKELKEGEKVAIVYQKDDGPRKYWNNTKFDGRKAYLDFWAKHARGGKTAATQVSTEGAQNLIQVNVESIAALYSTDLAKVFDSSDIRGDKRRFDSIPVEAWKKAPPPVDGKSAKGWVVELRGYTYHGARKQFLLDTLVDMLAKKAIGSKPAANPSAPASKTTSRPPATPPAAPTAPAAPAAAAPSGSSAPPKEDAANPKDDPYQDVIAERISHVILYHDWTDSNLAPPPPFKHIDESFLSRIVGDTSPASTPWKTIAVAGDKLTSSGQSSGGPAGGFERQQPVPPREMAPGGKGKPEEGTGIKRTEFVLIFFWNEPTPSDDRMSDAPGAKKAKGKGGKKPPGKPAPKPAAK